MGEGCRDLVAEGLKWPVVIVFEAQSSTRNFRPEDPPPSSYRNCEAHHAA